MPSGGKLGREGTNTRTAIAHPTTRDLEWAAGFLEGEGSFRQDGNSTIVRASQVHKPPVIRLLKMFGGRLVQYKYGKAQPAWHWCTSGKRARGIAMTLYPLMSPKRQQQIKKALNVRRSK